MLNNINIMGRLVANPEMRMVGSGQNVTRFRIACDRDFERNKADFFDCVAWRATAEFVEKYFSKGDPILIAGRIQMRDWEDREGNKRRSFEIIANNVYFCGGKAKKSEPVDVAPEFDDFDSDDDDCPFELSGDDQLPL